MLPTAIKVNIPDVTFCLRILALLIADDNTLKAESKEELKSLLMKVQEESERAGL